jgi:hypothetical protein
MPCLCGHCCALQGPPPASSSVVRRSAKKAAKKQPKPPPPPCLDTSHELLDGLVPLLGMCEEAQGQVLGATWRLLDWIDACEGDARRLPALVTALWVLACGRMMPASGGGLIFPPPHVTVQVRHVQHPFWANYSQVDSKSMHVDHIQDSCTEADAR